MNCTLKDYEKNNFKKNKDSKKNMISLPQSKQPFCLLRNERIEKLSTLMNYNASKTLDEFKKTN